MISQKGFENHLWRSERTQNGEEAASDHFALGSATTLFLVISTVQTCLAAGTLPQVTSSPSADQPMTRPQPLKADFWLARWFNNNWALEADCIPSLVSCNQTACGSMEKMVPLGILLRLSTVRKHSHAIYPLTSICKWMDMKGQILTYLFPLGHCKALNKGVSFGVPPSEDRLGRGTCKGLCVPMDSRHYGAISPRGVRLARWGHFVTNCRQDGFSWWELVSDPEKRREKWSSEVALSSSSFSEVKIWFYNFIIVRKYHDAGIPCILYSCWVHINRQEPLTCPVNQQKDFSAGLDKPLPGQRPAHARPNSVPLDFLGFCRWHYWDPAEALCHD